jgi:hypothetical protein
MDAYYIRRLHCVTLAITDQRAVVNVRHSVFGASEEVSRYGSA